MINIGLKLIILNVFVLEFLHRFGLVPNLFTMISDFVILLMIPSVVLTSKKNNKKQKKFKIDIFVIFIFLILIVVSHIYNDNNLFHLIMGLRSVFKFILFYFIFVNLSVKTENLISASMLLKKLIIIQPFMVIVEYFLFVHKGVLSYEGTIQDLLTGTLGGGRTHVLAVVCSMVVYYFLVKFEESNNKKYLLYIFWFLIPPLLASVKFFFFMLLIALCFFIYKSKNKLKNKVLIVTFVIVGGIFTNIIYYYISNDNYVERMTKISFYEKSADLNNQIILGRIASVLYVKHYLLDNIGFFIGKGLGSTFEPKFGFSSGKYYFEDARKGIYSWQSSWSFLETGILGIILLCIFYLFWLRKKEEKNNIQNNILQLLKIYILVLIPYMPTFYMNELIFLLAFLGLCNNREVQVL